jgi:hypothetical protein
MVLAAAAVAAVLTAAALVTRPRADCSRYGSANSKVATTSAGSPSPSPSTNPTHGTSALHGSLASMRRRVCGIWSRTPGPVRLAWLPSGQRGHPPASPRSMPLAEACCAGRRVASLGVKAPLGRLREACPRRISMQPDSGDKCRTDRFCSVNGEIRRAKSFRFSILIGFVAATARQIPRPLLVWMR